MEGSPRELNLSDQDRKAMILALSYTTHPSALAAIIKSVEATLRQQSHPNFVRWSVSNGNPARISFACTVGWAAVVAALALAIILTLSGCVGRGWRALAALLWVPGVWTVVASYRGMCICMYTFSPGRQHVRPWDLFADVEYAKDRCHRSFDSFGSSNSYEDEPWVVRYEKQGLLRKIFDREVRIQEVVVRQIHDTIFMQAGLSGLLAGAIFVAIFVPLPSVNLF
jgi:hypothetical protein